MFRLLKNYLEKRLPSYDFRKDLAAQEAIVLYNDWVENRFNEKEDVQAVSFKDGVLKVRAPDSVIIQELKLAEPELKNSLENIPIERIIYQASS